MNFTAIDFETANRKRSSACSIGMAKVRDGKVVDTYYRLLRPDPLDFEYINIVTHGITPEMVSEENRFLEVWEEISAFIDNDVLVAHNASFEQSVINQTLTLHGHPVPELDYLCTLYMSRLNYPRRMGYRLPDVYKDIFGKEVNHHNALEDAIACAELGVHMIGLFREQDPKALISTLYEIPIRQKKEWTKLTGIKPTREELDPEHPLFDKVVVLTGVLHSMSREKAVQYVVDCGGIYGESVTKKTNYLVMGDQDYQQQMFGGKSTKTKKVEEMNTKGANIVIIGETEFLKLVVP